MGRNGYQTVATPYLREVRTVKTGQWRRRKVAGGGTRTLVAVEHLDERVPITTATYADVDGGCTQKLGVRVEMGVEEA